MTKDERQRLAQLLAQAATYHPDVTRIPFALPSEAMARRLRAAAASIEPNTEPPCDHPEAGWQKDLFGDCVYCCTFCGAELPEPKPTGEWSGKECDIDPSECWIDDVTAEHVNAHTAIRSARHVRKGAL